MFPTTGLRPPKPLTMGSRSFDTLQSHVRRCNTLATRLPNRSVLVLLLLMALIPSRAVHAQDSFSLSAVLATGPYYPNDRWLPVRVLVTNRSTQTISGEV